jgi:DNA-binding NtrC family response regulator
MSHPHEILIVDDESIVCERLKAFIEKEGHQVETFLNPVEALERLGAKDFDILISDIRMREIDGIQLMERALEKAPHIKVIMITGYATMQLAREAMAKGAFDFIAKPFKSIEIRSTIEKATEEIAQDRHPSVAADMR